MPEPIAAPVVAPKPKEVFIDDMEDRFEMYRVLSNGDEVEIIQSKKEEKKPVSVEEAFNMNPIPEELPYFLKRSVQRPWGLQYDAFCDSLPPYNFYMEDEPELSDLKVKLSEGVLNRTAAQKLETKEAHTKKKYKEEADILAELISEGYWEEWPYTTPLCSVATMIADRRITCTDSSNTPSDFSLTEEQ